MTLGHNIVADGWAGASNPHPHSETEEDREEQVTRGHNIVADGWAGASKPYSHPNPPPTLKHTQKVSKTLVFNSITMTDRPTDGPTDGQSLL